MKKVSIVLVRICIFLPMLFFFLYCLMYYVKGQPPITIIDSQMYYTYTSDLRIYGGTLSKNDIEKLGQFQWVKKLYLWPIKIDDISFLESMNDLEELTLGGFPCEIENWLPINNCKKLNRIFAWNVGITSLDVFKELTQLKYLNLQENNISDISGIKFIESLEELYIWGEDMQDISSIRYATNLKHLKIYSEGLSDISPISSLKYLESLSLYGCSNVADISSLQYCKNLKHLNISSTSVKDISVLSSLCNLEIQQ